MAAPVPAAVQVTHDTAAGTAQIAQRTNGDMGVSNGDILYAHVCIWNATAVINTVPTGWVLVRGPDGGANCGRAWVYRKIITDAANEPTSYTWVEATVNFISTITLVKVTGADTTEPTDAHNGQYNATADLTLEVPSVTTLGPDRLIIVFGGGGAVLTTFTMPGTLTEAWDSNNSPNATARSVCGGYATKAVAGVFAASVITVDGATGMNTVGQIIAVVPGATDTTPPAAPTGLTATVVP